MTLKQAVWFGVLTQERKTNELMVWSTSLRTALNADKDKYREFLKELEDGIE